MVMALAVALYRKELIGADDLATAADSLLQRAATGSDEEADRLSTAAHLLTTVMLEAEMPSERDWEAEQARSRFRVVKSDPERG
jgi:hypothetical protein